MKNAALIYNPNHGTIRLAYTESGVGETYMGRHETYGVIEYSIIAAEPCTEAGLKFAKLIFEHRIKRLPKLKTAHETFEYRVREAIRFMTALGKLSPAMQDLAYEKYSYLLQARRDARLEAEAIHTLHFLIQY